MSQLAMFDHNEGHCGSCNLLWLFTGCKKGPRGQVHPYPCIFYYPMILPTFPSLMDFHIFLDCYIEITVKGNKQRPPSHMSTKISCCALLICTRSARSSGESKRLKRTKEWMLLSTKAKQHMKPWIVMMCSGNYELLWWINIVKPP